MEIRTEKTKLMTNSDRQRDQDEGSSCFRLWLQNQRISQGFYKPLQLLQSFSIFLHACESWTLTVELEKRAQASEMRYY